MVLEAIRLIINFNNQNSTPLQLDRKLIVFKEKNHPPLSPISRQLSYDLKYIKYDTKNSRRNLYQAQHCLKYSLEYPLSSSQCLNYEPCKKQTNKQTKLPCIQPTISQNKHLFILQKKIMENIDK